MIAALPPVPAPGTALVRVTTAAREADEAWAAAHEFDNPESAAAAEAHATAVAKNASAPTVLIIDKFPKFLTRKHLGTWIAVEHGRVETVCILACGTDSFAHLFAHSYSPHRQVASTR